MGNVRDKVQGMYWHVECIHDDPGYIRRDDGGEPERGNFVDRAITAGHMRRLDKGERASCHACLRWDGPRKPSVGESEDFVVMDYELTASICGCGRTDHGTMAHQSDRELADEIWRDTGPMEGAKVADKLICGDCWYKDNSMPPDKRETMETAISCHVCGDPTKEVVVIKGKTHGGMTVQTDEIDGDPSDYRVKITWTRQHNVTVTYEYFIDDLDEHDLEVLRDNEFNDVAWDIASDESTRDNETDTQFYDWADEGPDDIGWEVLAK